jgi:hypothetical protein
VSGYLALKQVINDVWFELYKGEPVEELHKLVNRVKYIADDRNCFVFNTKMADKETKRLEEKLNELQHLHLRQTASSEEAGEGDRAVGVPCASSCSCRGG